ncbi:MAG: ribulose-phosphate 3-epimerase [Flavobacteriales bacterium]
MIVSPSLLSCDFANIQRDVEMLNESAAEWIHIDVMDGVFVPNISFGIPILSAVRKHTQKVLDVHLMIANADAYLSEFKKAGADIITVHAEACPHLHRTIQAIKDLGLKAGVALNPHTPLSILNHVLKDLDLVLIMSVNPGFGGQKFIPEAVQKVKDLKQMKQDRNADFIIEVDGGVNSENAPLLSEAGANALVAGSFVFNSTDPILTIQALSTV